MTPVASDRSAERSGYRAADDFIGRCVFPGGDLVPSYGAFRRSGRLRSARHREPPRALCSHAARLGREPGRQSSAAAAATDERTERIWRIYMARSAHGFSLGRMGLMQTLFAKPRPDGSVDMPATRRDLYAAAS